MSGIFLGRGETGCTQRLRLALYIFKLLLTSKYCVSCRHLSRELVEYFLASEEVVMTGDMT